MLVDWNLVAAVAVPVICLFLGGWVNRKYEKRPELISYIGHMATFDMSTSENSLVVNTHTVVIRNAGGKSATNVRMTHGTLPKITIYPPTKVIYEELSVGGVDLVFPVVVPNAVITISYLYIAPLQFVEINKGIKHDDGFAKQIPVILQRQYPRWMIRMSTSAAVVGVIAILYLLIKFSISVSPGVLESLQGLVR
ncbi:hypothetical protein NPS46_20700 [Pseudomonas putida]|uniref:hypothetical protein n=1 Tax=Pseudomonas putida TaxID=303 RepID=UPI002363C5B4|nr:hypothetical protein [Pseudomonas putida]MDD2054972.1 hypothetical protein [Pseudomonas putida]